MRTKILFLLVLLSMTYAYSQKSKFTVKTRALDIGVYDHSKVKNHRLKILYNEEARNALERRIEGNQNLIDFIGGYLSEQSIISYYPEVNIALLECPVRSIGVYDIKNMKDGYGDPKTYTYSPSGKYRFSILVADGVHYYLEEKKNTKYDFISEIFSVSDYQDLSGFYWYDDQTLYYLKKRKRNDKSIYWVAYSTKVNFEN